MTVDAAILAGGRARRMGGRNKALLLVDGQRIVERQLAVLAPLVSEVLLVTGDPVPYAGVSGARVVLDHNPGLGPLAGIQAAFYASGADALLVVACDLPFLDARLLALVRDYAPGAQAVVPRVANRPQPLHARFARSVLPSIDARLRAQELRVLDWLAGLDVTWLEEPALRAVDPTLRGLTNVNTPEELQSLS